MITNYTTLKDAVASWLNRSDLTSNIPEFIQLAEASFIRDERVRKLINHGTFSIAADGDELPSDLDSIESWFYDGDTYFGPIEIVPSDMIPLLKAQHGSTGVPSWAAITERIVRYAPSPDQGYTTYLTYWAGVTALSDASPTNWLITNHPDIYLFGALVHSAPWLRDDERVGLWAGMLEKMLEELHKQTQRAQFSGRMRLRVAPRRVIG